MPVAYVRKNRGSKSDKIDAEIFHYFRPDCYYVDIRSRQRVGKYGVDAQGFGRFLDTIQWHGPDVGLVVIDEIGKMGCFSEKFRALVRRILDSNTPVLATVASRGSGLITEVKRRPDVELIDLTTRNRDALAAEIVRRFTRLVHRSQTLWLLGRNHLLEVTRALR